MTTGAAGVTSATCASFNLERILSELGSFGKYQLLLLFLLSFRDSFLSMCNFNYVFTAADVHFRCFDEHGQQVTCAARTGPDMTGGNTTERTADTGGACQSRVYDNYDSVVAEFDLGCDPWKRTLIGTVHNLGLVFSSVVSGFISDKYGRKVIIVGTPLAVAVCGLIKSFSVNYVMLLVLEFLETALGYGNASLVLSLEMVSQHSRVVYSSVADVLSNIGGATFGLLAWKVPYWRHLMRAIYAPLLVAVFYTVLVDEGVRWLLAHDRRQEAARVLHKVAKVNNVTLSDAARAMLAHLDSAPGPQKKATGATKEVRAEETENATTALRSRAMAGRVALVAACFFFSLFVYNGALVNSGGLSGDARLNYSLLLLVSVPTRLLSAYALTRFGRRVPICAAYSLCGLCFLASAFVPPHARWAQTTLYMCGKMCSSFAVFALMVLALEVFPTTARNSLTNLAATVGRLGSVLAPQAPLLERYMSGLPSVVLGASALAPAALVLLLPDSGSARLPDKVRDAEMLAPPAAHTPHPAHAGEP